MDLNLSLNEIVEQEVLQRTSELEQQVETQQKEIYSLKTNLKQINQQLSDLELASILLTKLKENKKDLSNLIFEEQKKEEYLQFSNILINVFNATEMYKFNYDKSVIYNLALNFYKNKEEVILLIKLFISDSYKQSEYINLINSFKMPYDYDKETIIKLLTRIDSHTNGVYIPISSYWKLNLENVPYSLVLSNPVILEDDVFDVLVNSVDKQINDFHYLYEVYKFQPNLTLNKIQKLGRTIMKLKDYYFKYPEIESFISKNINKFDNDTLDFCYTKITNDNQYKLFHWEKFPVKYQTKYLMDKELDVILKLFSNYSCKWTLEEKNSFLTKYYNTDERTTRHF